MITTETFRYINDKMKMETYSKTSKNYYGNGKEETFYDFLELEPLT